ncbi:MAG: hypothetical protein GXP06_00455 [Alphaproteobacteria bacterium]|nr:hypothetical protein [Alphaproteobacteria bacterium]
MRQPYWIIIFLFGVFAVTLLSEARADQEASNVAYVATDEYGRCFAHSIPDAYFEPGGKTHIYAAGDELVLLQTFPWYAQRIYIACNASDGKGMSAPAIVQMGPWPRGHKPNAETLAIAFHYNGKELARYSTLDIADGDPANASCSVSHYTVIQEEEGLVRRGGDTLFRLVTIDGRRLTFSATTGALIDTEQTSPVEFYGECFGGRRE